MILLVLTPTYLETFSYYRIGTFMLDIAIGDIRPTPRLRTVIHSDSTTPVIVYLRKEMLHSSFGAISTHRTIGFVPLYFTNASTDDSQLI